MGKMSVPAAGVMLAVQIVLSVSAAAEQLELEGLEESSALQAFWTDTAPVLDGKMDDACWKDAPESKEFILLGGNSPAQYQARARVCYDAEKIYVFMRADGPPFTKEELDISRPGRKFQGYGEMLLGWDELGFLLENPVNKHVDCFCFATDPLARRSDSRSDDKNGIERFNPLEVRTSRDANGWSAEMGVPFIELGSWYANLGSTPAPGAVWKILFFRNHGRFSEFSTSPAAKEGYRKNRQLGEIVFKGRRSGPQLPSVTMNIPGADDTHVEIKSNSEAELKCRYVQIFSLDNLVEKGEKAFKGSLQLPWLVSRSREYDLSYMMNVQVLQEGKLVFTGLSQRNICPGYYHYDFCEKLLKMGIARLEGLPGKRAADLLGKFNALKKRCDELKARLDSCERHGDKQWNEASDEILRTLRQKTLEGNPEYSILPCILRALEKARVGLAAHKETPPQVPEIKDRAEKLKPELDNLLRRAEECPNSRQEVEKLAADTADFARAAEVLDFDAWRAQLAAKAPGAKFAALPISAYAKSFPKRKLGITCKEKIVFSLAGGEGESFQIYLAPLNGEVKDMDVSFSPLSKVPGGAAEIPASAFSWRIVNYMLMLGAKDGENPLANEDPEAVVPQLFYPDPLYPGKPFILPADDQRTVWIDLQCPPKTPPGEYSGKVAVSGGGAKFEIPISVHVFAFDLPEKPTLRVNHWFAPFYGKKIFGEGSSASYTPEMFEQDCAFLAKYRLPHFVDDRSAFMENVRFYLEKDGSFTADFSEIAKFYDIAQKYGANWVKASLSCNAGAFCGWDVGCIRFTDRQTGKERLLSEIIPEFYEKMKFGEAAVMDNPAWQSFFRQFADFLDKRGLLEKNAYYEICDESGVDVILKTHKKLKDICPKMPLGNFGPHPLQVNRDGETSFGLTDIWGPHLTKLDDPKMADAIRERVGKHGERCMAYLCNSFENAPHVAIHRSFLGPRLAHWQAWRHNIDAFLMFMINNGPINGSLDKKIMEKPLETRFDGPWEIDKGMEEWGGAYLLPGPDRTMIPTMRLTALRDGMEDYEYFQILKARADAFKPGTDEEKKLLESARSALDPPQDICGGICEWTTDESKVNAHRARLAELIAKLPP